MDLQYLNQTICHSSENTLLNTDQRGAYAVLYVAVVLCYRDDLTTSLAFPYISLVQVSTWPQMSHLKVKTANILILSVCDQTTPGSRDLMKRRNPYTVQLMQKLINAMMTT